MGAYNLKGVTSALPASWERTGYLMEEGRVDEKGRGGITYPAQSYPMPTPYPPHAPMEHPSAPGYNAPPPTYEQATDATAKQPPYNPYAPS
ncbi:hypothetical protein EVAR_88881_1 [Eumeta japonica]|uniref:Uncharacterized protein n=1 Tax=Eumeta variegata TaxID=151549 RepID=A0A4C1XZU0_EUMVA|nr:hypothetical protein EVAR_88881_1 [Eumeta japonica]